MMDLFKKPYGLFKGVEYAVILYSLLWWLPIFGAMITGYVAGRKAGGPFKGVIVVSVPIGALIVLSYFLSHSYATPSTYNYPATITAFVPSSFVYFYFTMKQIGTSILNFEWFIHYAPSDMVILAIFGYIGGLLSQQIREEKLLTEFERSKEEKKKGYRKVKEFVEEDRDNMIEQDVELPKKNPLVKRAEKQKHEEAVRRKKKPDTSIDYL